MPVVAHVYLVYTSPLARFSIQVTCHALLLGVCSHQFKSSGF